MENNDEKIKALVNIFRDARMHAHLARLKAASTANEIAVVLLDAIKVALRLGIVRRDEVESEINGWHNGYFSLREKILQNL